MFDLFGKSGACYGHRGFADICGNGQAIAYLRARRGAIIEGADVKAHG